MYKRLYSTMDEKKVNCFIFHFNIFEQLGILDVGLQLQSAD